MKWSEYYERFDGWQASTQYSRLASITDFGPEGSPSAEICESIQRVEDSRTAASILQRAMAAGVRFTAQEITDIVDYGDIEDNDLLYKLIQTNTDDYNGEQLDILFSILPDEEPVFALIDKICSKPTHFTEEDIITLLPIMPDDASINKLVASTDARFSEEGLNELCDYEVDESLIKKISKRSGIPYADPYESEEEVAPEAQGMEHAGLFGALLAGSALFGGSKAKSTGKCTGDCAHCPPHYGYRYGRWYYGHGHIEGCEFCGNGGSNGRCSID